MEDGVPLDVPSFSSPLLTSLLVYFMDLGPVQMSSARISTTSGDKSSGGGVSPCAGSAEWLPYGIDRLWRLWVVRLRTFSGYLIVSFPFLLMYGLMQPRGSAHQEGDNVMARLHMTYPGPGNTRIIYSGRHHPWIFSDNLPFILLYNIDIHVCNHI